MENLKTDSVADEIETVDASPQNTVGEQLRAARQASGLEMAELASRMKLGVRQLEALENGDWSSLPGHTFIRGFVRNYARMVNLDPQLLMAQLDAVVARPGDVLHVPASSQNPVSYSSTGTSRDRNVVFAGLGALALAAIIYFVLPSDLQGWRNDVQQWIDSLSRNDEVVASQPAAPVTPEPVFPPGTTPQQIMTPQALVQPEPVQGGEQKPVAATGDTPLEFVAEKAAWVEVKDRDGKTVFSQKLAAGTSQRVAGEGPLSVVVGFAPGVRLMWRGQLVDLEPHTRGDVARLVLE